MHKILRGLKNAIFGEPEHLKWMRKREALIAERAKQNLCYRCGEYRPGGVGWDACPICYWLRPCEQLGSDTSLVLLRARHATAAEVLDTHVPPLLEALNRFFAAIPPAKAIPAGFDTEEDISSITGRMQLDAWLDATHTARRVIQDRSVASELRDEPAVRELVEASYRLVTGRLMVSINADASLDGIIQAVRGLGFREARHDPSTPELEVTAGDYSRTRGDREAPPTHASVFLPRTHRAELLLTNATTSFAISGENAGGRQVLHVSGDENKVRELLVELRKHASGDFHRSLSTAMMWWDDKRRLRDCTSEKATLAFP